MQRFYFPVLEASDESVIVKNPNLLNQLIKVLRVKIGDEVIFFNWHLNIDFIFKIKQIDKREVYLEKISEKENNSEIDFDLNVFSALPNKLEKIEYVISKWVEVWVTWFYFFRSKRSQKLNISGNKIERLQKIITEAVEQSWRSRIPELIIEDNISLSDFEDNENIVFHTKDSETVDMKNLKLDYSKWINLFVWPEWGFADEEVDIFNDLWFTKVHLGNRILRTETTPVVTSFFIIQNK